MPSTVAHRIGNKRDGLDRAEKHADIGGQGETARDLTFRIMIVEEQEDQDSGLREPAHLLHEKEAGLTIASGSFGMSLFTRKPPPSPMIQTVVKPTIQAVSQCRP